MVDLWHHVPGIRGGLGESENKHHENYQGALERVRSCGTKAIILRGNTLDMAKTLPDGLLGFVHLDATHEYDDTLADLRAWYPKLVCGGIMSGHDYLNPDWGVKQAVDEFAAELRVHVHAIDEQRTEHACFWFEKGDE